MTAYDVQVENAGGTSGDTLRIEAESPEAAGAAALARVPEGWKVGQVSDATDHGEAWGVDTTTNDVPPAGPLIGEGEVVPPTDNLESIPPEPEAD